MAATKKRTSKFTNTQKAEMFTRDHATCGYTGKSLWLLDGGLDPHFDPDWADHRVPLAKGGDSSLANGVSACYSVNSEKRDSVDTHVCIFLAGKPTLDYFKSRRKLSPRLERHFARFSRLDPSDWYFNRAVFLLILGVGRLSEYGRTLTRDDLYYARAAFRMITTWMRLTKKSHVLSLEARGLAPDQPRADQVLLLTLRDARSVEEVRRMIRHLGGEADVAPLYGAS